MFEYFYISISSIDISCFVSAMGIAVLYTSGRRRLLSDISVPSAARYARISSRGVIIVSAPARESMKYRKSRISSAVTSTSPYPIAKQYRRSFEQSEKLVIRKALQPYYRAEKRLCFGGTAEHRIVKARSQRLIAEKSAPLVLKKLRRTGKYHAQPLRLSLKRIVEYRKYLFVVVLARNAVRYLIKIYALVDENDKSAISDLSHKACHELYVIVPIFVIYYSANAERRLCLCFRSELTAKPSEAACLLVLVKGADSRKIRRYDLCEIKRADAALNGAHRFKNAARKLRLKLRRIVANTARRYLI